ncbi:MAG: SulP family inorganic anion transporter [Burkholderiaceae bacterium]|nr:SulP family inorganic anion transporter [Burkholderiaceae bacterium]
MSDSAPVPAARQGLQSARPSGWRRWLPGLHLLSRYDPAWLRHDLLAGLVLPAVMVPVGIAYALASGVPAIAGLYATIFGLLAYALFGPSRVLVLGPDSTLVALVIGVVLPLSGGDPARAMSLAAMLAIVSGGLCVAAGLARLGFVTELLSKPIRYGYLNGIALTVVVSQLPALLGIASEGAGIVGHAQSLIAAVRNGQTQPVALLLGLATLAVLAVFKRRQRLPGVLIVVVCATAVSALFDLGLRTGLAVVGPLPQGLPGFALPLLNAGDIMPVLLGGLAVALVSFADTSVLARSYAARSGSRQDANQEMIALGAANLSAGLFQGIPVSASASRTPVAEAAGARTQLAGVIGALAVALMLQFAPGLLQHLPKASLAAVVITAAMAMLTIADLRRIYRVQPWEFWLSIGCTAGVVVLGPIQGIGLAIAMALIEFLWAAWRPHFAVLGRVDGIKGYHDIVRHPEARVVPGLVLFRWDAPLFFANAELFNDRALEAAAASPTPVRWLVVGAEPITNVDITAADMLDELDHRLQAAGVQLCFAELKGPVKDKLKRFGLFSQIGEQRFFRTIGESVSAYLNAHEVDWVDWEDRPRQ